MEVKRISFVLLIVVLSSCIKFDFVAQADRRLYKTLVKNTPWKIATLKISLYHSRNDITPYWDTTLNDWGTFNFEKFNHNGFTSTLDFTENYPTLNVGHFTKMEDDKIYLSFKDRTDPSYLDFGSGYADAKKGDEINIEGKKYDWHPTVYVGGFSFAPFLKEQACYKCDWKLVCD